MINLSVKKRKGPRFRSAKRTSQQRLPTLPSNPFMSQIFLKHDSNQHKKYISEVNGRANVGPEPKNKIIEAVRVGTTQRNNTKIKPLRSRSISSVESLESDKVLPFDYMPTHDLFGNIIRRRNTPEIHPSPKSATVGLTPPNIEVVSSSEWIYDEVNPSFSGAHRFKLKGFRGLNIPPMIGYHHKGCNRI